MIKLIVLSWSQPLLNKEELRKHFRHQRKEISRDQARLAGEKAAELLSFHPLFKRSQHIGCYLANDNEFDSQPIIDHIWQHKKNCYLPILSRQQKNFLEFVAYTSTSCMKPNCYNILEPQNAASFNTQQLDLIFMPLVAFDLKGNRLGMGGGYYDHTFAFLLHSKLRKPALIGLAYDNQGVTQLPNDPWDVPLQGVLTEKKFILV